MYEYIDVRGAWPIYFKGNTAIVLTGWDRSITVEQARDLVGGIELVR